MTPAAGSADGGGGWEPSERAQGHLRGPHSGCVRENGEEWADGGESLAPE